MKTENNDSAYRYETPHFDEDRIDFSKKGAWRNQMEYHKTSKYILWSYFVATLIVILLIAFITLVTYFYTHPIHSTNDLKEHKNELFID